MVRLRSAADGIRGTPIAGDRLEAIVDSLRLIDIKPLRQYEQTDPVKVSEIQQSLLNTGILINPVVVDTELQLLIDGHHRVRAFEELGLARIPAFTVKYFAKELGVRGWNHATNAPSEDFGRVVDDHDGPRDGAWTVIFASPRRRRVASRGFESSLDGAVFRHNTMHRFRERGHLVTPEVEADALRKGLNHSYIEPVVGKAEVVAAVEEGKQFPPEVNRHLIEDRPLNLCIPITETRNAQQFGEHVGSSCDTATPLTVEPGSRHEGRFYEERVTFFQATDNS